MELRDRLRYISAQVVSVAMFLMGSEGTAMEVPKAFYWIMGISFAVLLLVLTQTSFFKHEKPQALRDGVEIVDLDSFWSEKTSSPADVTMVPVIRFRIRNKRAEPMEYVQVSAVFAFAGDEQNLGDSFAYPIQGTPLSNGQTTDLVVLRSNFGYRASSKQAFINNPAFKQVEARVFVQSRASGPVLVGTYQVSKRLEGVAEAPESQPVDVLPMRVN